MKSKLGVPVAIHLERPAEAVGRELQRQQVIEPAWIGMIKEPSHSELVPKLGKRQGSDAAMVVTANRADVGDLGGTILGKRFDVMEFYLAFVLNRVVIDEAVKYIGSALLRENLLFLRLSELPVEGRHS